MWTLPRCVARSFSTTPRRQSCGNCSTRRPRSRRNTHNSTATTISTGPTMPPLLANYDKARLGERADNAGGVRFQGVQPPIAQLAATSVHRNLLLVAVLIASLLIGGALTFAASLLRPVVSSARDLTQLTGFPVVGVVSAAFPHRLHVEARWSALRFWHGLESACVWFCGSAAVERTRVQVGVIDRRSGLTMSVVERALSKLRREADGVTAGSAASWKPEPGACDRSPGGRSRPGIRPPGPRQPVLAPHPHRPQAVRDAGYLPESGCDRQFADHYRQIKRPLIASAFAAAKAMKVPG